MSAAVVLGFNPVARAWSYGNGKKKGCHQLPQLDGSLVVDAASLEHYASDAGNQVHLTPVAVLIPGSVDDVRKMVCYCRTHHIAVAARGQGHTTFGQSMTDGGLVIDMAGLSQIHDIQPSTALVDGGVKWNTLLGETVQQGLTPPVLTGYLGLSVGGTLSVGGISSTNGLGAQVDHVQALEVVSGDGKVRWCSEQHHRALFEATLAGLGQYGIITRAVVDLVPAPTMARVYLIDHDNSASFFANLRTLLARGEFDDLYNFGFPDDNGGWVYQLTATKFYEPGSPPNDAHLLRDLSVPASSVPSQDMPYLHYAQRVDVVIDFFEQIGLWDGVLHPWYDVFLPEASVEPYVESVMSTLTLEDVGPTGFLLLFPQKRSAMTRPGLRVPHAQDWVYLFDVLTAAPTPGPNPDFQARMLQRNRQWFEQARAVGGTRYPIGSLEFSKLDWILHYQERWPTLKHLKKHYDPAGILTPGPGIF
ncbi:MAG: FAD-binding protein [Polyangiaceae bacterium]